MVKGQKCPRGFVNESWKGLERPLVINPKCLSNQLNCRLPSTASFYFIFLLTRFPNSSTYNGKNIILSQTYIHTYSYSLQCCATKKPIQLHNYCHRISSHGIFHIVYYFHSAEEARLLENRISFLPHRTHIIHFLQHIYYDLRLTCLDGENGTRICIHIH